MLKVVKIGGNVVDNPEKLTSFLEDFAALEGPKVLVHGGGKIATTISKALGIETQMIEGRRVTDAQTLDVVTMVYAELVNKKIVARLQGLQVNAFGLCGADGSLMPSLKRIPNPIDFGYVGDPIVERFSVSTAQMLIDSGYTLVVAPITHTGTGMLLNTNADTVAQTVAVALSGVYEVELVYCFEKKGVLSDINDEYSVIPRITLPEYELLKKSGVVVAGMIPKLDNAFKAIASGVKSVVICGSDAIAAPGYGGTKLVGE